jgi:hypothetical protein
MDRLNRNAAGCGLMLMLATAGGCRSTRPEVPPGRPYTNDGRQVPPINFSSDPHPMTGPGIVAGPGAPGAPQYGTPSSASSANFGAPTGNQYGPPGTATGVGTVPAGAGYSSEMEPSSMPSTGLGMPSGGTAPPQGAPPGQTGQPGMPPGSP